MSSKDKASRKKYDATYYEAHKEEVKTYQVAYREANREKIKARKAAYHKAHGKEAREYQAAHRHGLSELDILAMRAAQSNRCACCDEIFTASPNVDHDHHCCEANRSCDKCRRGLLCSNCNRGLGMFRDSIERLLKAVEYLKRHAKNHLRQQHEIIESDGR